MNYANGVGRIVHQSIYKPTAWLALSWYKEERHQRHTRVNQFVPSLGEVPQNLAHHIFDALAPLGEILAKNGIPTESEFAPHSNVCGQFEWTPEMFAALKAVRAAENQILNGQKELEALEPRSNGRNACSVAG
jgi:hypothetical protein